ncbi:MAG TPA: NAD(P)-dependent oxidoreductase [Candidatus Saccharimonadales bacterium]|nr:NAD(P)-dependent oxidoreductase [Candidatus Saccharimonadales bacterium]
MKLSVGFIGLGLMGRPMGANLLKAGHELTVWNRTASRADELVAQGAKRAGSPREVAAESDVVITIVSDPPALESVLWGDGGVFAGLRQGSLMIESSTVSPGLEKRAAAAAAAHGAEFLEAPVTGGTWGAEKGELVFMVGGEEKTLKRAEPVLGAMGKKWFHLGPIGAGQTVKVAMNLLLDLEVEAFAEALALVTKAGVPGQSLLEVMQSSMGRSPVIDLKGANMLKGEYKPSFPLRLMHKDLGLALDLANQLGVPLPAAAAAREVLSAVKGAMTEDVDFSALATFWQKK